jgi:predicted nucleic acid-binding protein
VPKTRTFVDTNVLIAAFHDQGATGDAAEKLLADPNREFVASDIVRLELLPKPVFFKQQPALSFFEDFFTTLCTELLETTPALVKQAEAEACQAGLSAHLATAAHC